MIKKNIRTLSIFLISLLFTIILVGCGSSEKTNAPTQSNSGSSAPSPQGGNSAKAELPTNLAKLYEAAKKEGKVIFWSADDAPLMAKYEKKFNEKYPGIKVEHFEIQPGEAIEKMITEANAGQVNVDSFDTLLNYMTPMIERDLVQPYKYGDVFGIKATHFDNRMVGIYHLSIPIVYNTNLVKENEAPKSWDELLDPKWKGKILIESRGLAFPILAQEWGKEKAMDYLNKLLAQSPLIIKGGTPTMQAIASGERAIAIGTYAFKVQANQKNGAPLEWAKVGPVPAMSYIAGALKNAPHPNAAILWNGWIASEEGLKAREEIIGSGMLTTSDTISSIGKKMAANNIKVIPENEKNLKDGTDMLKEVVKVISSLK